MELDDLKQKWADHDAKLDRSLRLNLQILRDSSLGRVGKALRPLSAAIVIEGLLNVLTVLVLGSFLGDHITEPRFAVPAALLFVCALAILNAGIRQWVGLRTIDYGAPVVAIQKRLAALNVSRIRATKWVFLLSPLIWTPLLIVGIKGLTGVDPYRFLDGKWLAANVLFGLAFLGATLWVAKRYGDRWKRTPAMRGFMDAIADRSIVSANGYLDELARFEAEPIAVE